MGYGAYAGAGRESSPNAERLRCEGGWHMVAAARAPPRALENLKHRKCVKIKLEGTLSERVEGARDECKQVSGGQAVSAPSAHHDWNPWGPLGA